MQSVLSFWWGRLVCCHQEIQKAGGGLNVEAYRTHSQVDWQVIGFPLFMHLRVLSNGLAYLLSAPGFPGEPKEPIPVSLRDTILVVQVGKAWRWPPSPPYMLYGLRTNAWHPTYRVQGCCGLLWSVESQDTEPQVGGERVVGFPVAEGPVWGWIWEETESFSSISRCQEPDNRDLAPGHPGTADREGQRHLCKEE